MDDPVPAYINNGTWMCHPLANGQSELQKSSKSTYLRQTFCNDAGTVSWMTLSRHT